jgi:hypothetical protein
VIREQVVVLLQRLSEAGEVAVDDDAEAPDEELRALASRSTSCAPRNRTSASATVRRLTAYRDSGA